MEIKELQERVDAWIREYGVRYFSELTNMACLTEEVGELARVMARKYGDQSFKAGEKENLADEMADVLWVLVCLANQTGVDLTAAVERDIAGIAVAGDNNAVFDGCENYGNITVVANHKTDKWRPIVAGIVAIENDKVTTITNCTCKCTIDATLYQATSIGAVYVFQKTWEKGVEDTKTVCDEASKTNSAETTIKITTRE